MTSKIYIKKIKTIQNSGNFNNIIINRLKLIGIRLIIKLILHKNHFLKSPINIYL